MTFLGGKKGEKLGQTEKRRRFTVKKPLGEEKGGDVVFYGPYAQ